MADDEEDVFLPKMNQAGQAIGSAMNRPEVMAALLQFGLSSLSGRPFGHAVGEAGEAVSRLQEGDEKARKTKLAEDAAAERADREREKLDLAEEEAASRQGERQNRANSRGFRGLLAQRREERMANTATGRGRTWAERAQPGTSVVQEGVTYVKQLDGSWKPKSTSLQVQQPEQPQPAPSEVASG